MSRSPILLDPPILKGSTFTLNGHTFENGGPRWVSQITKDSQQFVYEGITQGTEEFNAFKKSLYSACRFLEEEPVDPNNSGNPGYILVDYGSPGSLAPFAPQDNSQIRESYGLKPASSDILDKFETFLDIVFEKCSFSKLRLSRTSMSGFPYFTKGSIYKKELMKFYRENGEKVNEAVLCKNLDKCLQYGVFPAYGQGIRKHFYPARWNEENIAVALKERKYATVEHILEGKFAVDISNFQHRDPQLLRYDPRSMYSMNSMLNFPNMVYNNFIAQGLKAFDCWNYEGPLKLEERLKENINEAAREGKTLKIFTIDKSKFGETFEPRLVEAVVKRAYKYFKRSYADIICDCINWPTFYRCIESGKSTALWSYDWRQSFITLDDEDSFRSAFKSGNGLVAVMNKLLGAFDVVLRYLKLRPLASIESILNNEQPGFFFKNTGDDTIAQGEAGFMKIYADNISESLHADQVEDINLYLGWTYEENGEARKDICRLLAAWTCYERTRVHKMAPRAGFKAQLQDYQTNPYLDIVLKEYESCLKRTYNFSLKNWLDMTDPIQGLIISEADRLFLENPDAIHYKLDPEEISTELYSAYFHNVEVEEFEFMVM